MKGRGGVMMKPSLQEIVARLPDTERKPSPKAKHINEIWIKRGGTGKTSGSGPSGWKLRPARLLSRSLAGRTHGK